MSLVKVGSRHQVVIPKNVRTKMGVKPGDYVEIALHKGQGQALIKPTKTVEDVPLTDEPVGPKTRAAMRQALKEVDEGKTTGPFHSAEELVEHLHQETQPSKGPGARRHRGPSAILQ